MADVIPVTLSVRAEGAGGEVAEMTREVEISRIPVFQFGVFSDGDLSYFPSADFPFQGHFRHFPRRHLLPIQLERTQHGRHCRY